MIDFLKSLNLPPGADYPYTVSKANTTQHVVQKFIDTKAHRLYIVDKEGAPIGIISLVDVIELFFRHLIIG